MKPFPGVNPYIEAERYWDDFHSTFLPVLRETLLAVLPPHYDATLNEQTLSLTPDDTKLRKPDITITHRPPTGSSSLGGTATLVQSEPVIVEMLPMTLVEEKMLWVEVVNRTDRSLVTSIELLSPSKKDSRGRENFRAKRNALLHSGAHLVDIDLLLGGDRFEFRSPLPPAHFYAFVTRAEAKRHSEVYRWSVREPLPQIPIPLQKPDADVVVDLQAVYATAYQRAGYDRRLNYDKPPAAGDDTTRNWAGQTAMNRSK